MNLEKEKRPIRISQVIKEEKVKTDTIAVFYLAQAGFCFKDSRGQTVYLDPYLTDSCNRLFGFKRMIPSVITPEEVNADILVSTHSHLDHLDVDAVPSFAKNPKTCFVGSPDCEEVYRKFRIPEQRYSILKRGHSVTIKGITLKATYADHGKLAPEAVGFLIDLDGIKIYNVGDSAYAPKKIMDSLKTKVDIMISPINGKFGNMDAKETCRLAGVIKPKILIASHFWMFIQHNGDPEKFLKEAKKLPEGIRALVMAPGEKLIYVQG
ncbi:MAG: MBL fold metallo-hydrolase [Candidatus Omnitrophota bacterium]